MFDNIVKRIKIALGEIKADLVLKNAFIVDVFTQSIEVNDIAISDDIIAGIGKYSGIVEIDCTGLFVTPGFIDAHVHIESSMVTPEIYSNIIIKKGVTTSIADPHEITNVLGKEGMNFMLTSSSKSCMDIFFMLPSCVPATPFEDTGGIFGVDEIKKYISNDRVLGLGELMDVPSVVSLNGDTLKKIELFDKKIIDGHFPGINEKWLNAYLSCGVSTDHECTNHVEALSKVKRGMYVMLREGSSARNLEDILPAVTKDNYRRFLFCTDDRHIQHLIEEGSIDNCIRIAIEKGLDSINALTIASLNAAQCYGLKDRGAIAPGYKADLVIFDDIKNIEIKKVIKNGKICIDSINNSNTLTIPSSINLDYITLDDFKVYGNKNFINTIKIIPGSIETKKVVKPVKIEEGIVISAGNENINKIAVFERHKNSGKKSIGYIEGLNLKSCAIAQTISHDSHNIIVVGDNDKDMCVGVNRLIDINGGIVITSNGTIIEELSLPIGGLMTSLEPKLIVDKLKKLEVAAKKHGVCANIDPFLTLAFMSLPVIPEIKITTRGLFEFNNFKFIDLFSS